MRPIFVNKEFKVILDELEILKKFKLVAWKDRENEVLKLKMCATEG